jgi:hypothetical protein
MQKITNLEYFDLGHHEHLGYFDQGHCKRRQEPSPHHHRRHSDTGALLLTMVQISSLGMPVTIRLYKGALLAAGRKRTCFGGALEYKLYSVHTCQKLLPGPMVAFRPVKH